MPIIDNIVYGPPEVFIPAHLSYGQHIFDRLKEGGDKIAQICAFTGEKTTFREILQRSVNLGCSLRKLGIKRGDVVTLSSETRFEFTVAVLGVLYTGATISTLNVLYTPDEVTHVLNIVQPKLVICSQFSVTSVSELCNQFSCVEHIVQFGDEQLVPGVLLYETLIKNNVDINRFVLSDVNGAVDTMAVMCSSGTTGLPKGVELTHVNIMTETFHFHNLFGHATGSLMKQLDSCLSIAPWFHPFGFIVHLTMLSLNTITVFMARFDEEVYLKAIQDYKVNLAIIVPPIALFLSKHPLVDKYNLKSLSIVLCGAAPLSKELQLSVAKRLNLKSIAQGYGNTEMTMANMIDLSDGQKYGSCGTLSPGVRAKIVDVETRKPLGPNQTGELCLKGALRMKGYLGNRAASDELMDEDGFVMSGDIGYYDEDEYFYIVDRLKELIKYKGFQVAPAELEATLLQHKAVLDCGIVGKPDEEAGEVPTAFVVVRPGYKVTDKELMDYIAKKKSSFKQLRGGVIFVSEIPKNLSGKILRRELKKMLTNKSKL